MQLENEYENLKNMARYIDSGTKTISDCVKTKDYSALSSGEDDKLISDIKDGIDIFKKEVNDIMKQLSGLNGISSLMSQAANEIFELKKYGALLGLQFNSSPQMTDNAFSEPQGTKSSPPRSFDISSLSQKNQFSDPIYREINEDEYQTLPTIVPLLVKIDDMNKHYKNLIESGSFIITAENFSEIVPLSSSRLNAFTRALVQLNRMIVVEDNGSTTYKLL